MIDVGVDELSDFCQSLAQDVMREHEKRFAERIRAIREACNALGGVASRFEAAVRNSWGTMDKSASEYGTRMAQTIQEITRKLPQQQGSPTYQDAERFHDDSVDALNRIIKTVRKYVPKLRRGLRVEMAALNVALGKLETTVRSLGAALDESPGNKIETMRIDAQLLTQMHSEALKLRAEEAEQAVLLETATTKEKELLAATEKLDSEGAFLELKRYEDSLKLKEEEIKQFLQPVIKPLTKLERTAPTNKTQTIDVKTLRSLIERPVETVTTGQPFALMQLLNQLGDALGHGGLEIEERRRHKAEDTIQQVKEGAIERMREDYLTIQANVQETLRQLKANGLLDKREHEDQLLASTRRDKENLTARNAELHRRIDTITKSTLKQKTSLEQQMEKLTERPVKIQTT